jgi:hypothetical protein
MIRGRVEYGSSGVGSSGIRKGSYAGRPALFPSPLDGDGRDEAEDRERKGLKKKREAAMNDGTELGRYLHCRCTHATIGDDGHRG